MVITCRNCDLPIRSVLVNGHLRWVHVEHSRSCLRAHPDSQPIVLAP